MKSAVRYIYNVYMGKAAEFAQEKVNLKKQATTARKEELSRSPDQTGKDKTRATEKQGKDRSNPGSPKSNNALRRTFSNQADSPKEPNPGLTKRSTLSPKQEKELANKEDLVSPKLAGASKGQDLATSTNLVEWTYEYFQNRYGLKNVADKKFQQFIGSILKYKEKYPRFRLFGRFLQLYDELSQQDLKLYVDIVHNMFKTVLNFTILEQDEIILIPTVSAIPVPTPLNFV